MISDAVSEIPALSPLHGRRIRLLRILPGDDLAQICCEVRVIDLDREPRPKYAALSYAWGNPGSEFELSLNGRPVKVRKNLWRFLRQARQLPSIICDLIWIDALCVEQEDDLERTHQVALMGEIYSSAERAIAWLGPSYSRSDLALRDFARGASCWTTSRTASKKWTSPAASAIRSICMRRYWERLWIFQELLLAREALVLCGADSITMNKFIAFLLPIANRYDNDISVHAAEQFELKTVRQSPAMALMRQITKRHSNSSIYDLMISTRRLQCSEVMDRVYALLNVAGHAQEVITADYKLSLHELIHNVLRQHHNMLLEHRARDLPESFDAIIEQCDILSTIMGVDLGEVFRVPQDALVWNTNMPKVEFEPLDRAESDVGTLSALDTGEEEWNVDIIDAKTHVEASNDLYARGVHGNLITFSWAAYWKHDVVIDFMLTNISLATAFIEAVRMDHYVVVAALLRANNGKLRRNLDKDICGKATPLQWALYEGRFEIANLLVQAGADVNNRGIDHDEDTSSSEPVSFAKTYPLHLAAVLGTPETVILLLHRGAAIDSRSGLDDWDSMTAMEAALVHGRADTAQALRDTKPSCLHLVNWNSILAMAINRRKESGVKLILEHAFADYGHYLERFSPKVTMVQRAVELGYTEIVAAL
jgi:hypothetical protein